MLKKIIFFVLIILALVGILACLYYAKDFEKKISLTQNIYQSATPNTYKQIGDFIEVDFDEAMGISNQRYFKQYFKKPHGKVEYEFFKDLFNQNKPSIKTISNISHKKIPKIIHQIWPGRGGKSMPAKYVFFQNSIKKLHPGWSYIFWTEEKIQKENFDDIDLYNNARGYTEKADIARYMILKKYGGVYLDLDTYDLKSFDILADNYEFFAGLEPNSPIGMPHLINALIAAYPNHPILNETLSIIRKEWNDTEQEYEKGLLLGANIFWLIQKRTFFPLDSAFKKIASLDDKNIIVLPAAYFYPKYFNKGFFSYVKEYSICYHDFEKMDTNLTYLNFNIANKIFPTIISNSQIKYDSLGILYEKNFPSKVSFKKENGIADNFYFIEGEVSKEEIERWKKYYQTAKFKTISIDEVISNQDIEYGELLKLKLDPTEKELLVKLIILYNYGGVFISKGLYPVESNDNEFSQLLFELNNKYDFYSYLKPNSDKADISTGIIGSSKNNFLLEKTLDYISKSKSSKIYDKYNDNIYRYIYIGSNIIFPAIYFERWEY